MACLRVHRSRLLRSTVLLLLGLLLVACTAENNQAGSPALTRSVVTIDPAISGERQSMENMVDERFELLSLVFRLAGRSEYRDKGTDYQNKVAATFAKNSNHAAVRYATNLPLGYDAVFNFAVHMVEEDGCFVFLEDIDSLVEDGRWNRRTASEFLALLNNFYLRTHFAAFYEENIPFYQSETRRFVEQTYKTIDLEWFGAYVDPANLRCVYTPSSSRFSAYEPAPPFSPGGIYQVKMQKINASVVRMLPAFATVTTIVGEYDYAAALLQEFTERDVPLAIQYRDLHIGKRLLSWQSNIGDALFVYDLRTDTFIELPHEFATDEETSTDLRVTAIPGLDADYLYFSLMTGDEAAYLLRVE